MTMTVGMVGLGQIGMPIAKMLLEAGYTVYGYRRSAMDDLRALGGIPGKTPAEVAARCDVVLTCLPTDEALVEVVTEAHGLAAGAHPGLVVAEIGMQTMQAKEQVRAALAAGGAHTLDAPISGIPPMVLARKASFFVSGEQAAYERAVPIFQTLSDVYTYLGPFGCGSAMKAVANLLVAVHNLAAAEAMVLATKAGLDPNQVIQLINGSIAGSATFAVRAPKMAARSFEPPAGKVWQVQEFIGVIRSLSGPLGVPTPLLDTSAVYIDRAVAAGRGEQDVSALYAVLGAEAGIAEL
mgnify:CR=1 FL=1